MSIPQPYSRIIVGSFSVVLWFASSEIGNTEPLVLEDMIAKMKVVAPARIHIQRKFDQGLRASFETMTVDIFPDESASAMGFSAQHPEQQTLYFVGENRILRYGTGVLGKNGRVEPAIPGKVHLTAFVNLRRGTWDHPAAEAFQWNLTRFVEGVPLDLSEKGEFTYSDPKKKIGLNGRFSSTQNLFTSFTYSDDSGDTTYNYSNITNFHGWFFPQSMTLTVRRSGRTLSESQYSFRFEQAKDLLPASLNLNPPVGALITDERVSPSLTYYANKEKYSNDELALMHKVQGEQKGALVQSGEAPSPVKWFQWAGLLLVVVVPVISFLALRRKPKHG